MVVGVIDVIKTKTYHAFETTGDYIRAEQIGTELSDLFNPIHFSEISIDGVVYGSVNETISALNSIIFTDVNKIVEERLEDIEPESIEEGVILVGTTGAVFNLNNYDVSRYNTTGFDEVLVSGRSAAGNFTLLCAYDENDNYLGDVYRGESTNYNDTSVSLDALFPNHSYIKISGNNASPAGLKAYVTTELPYLLEEDLEQLNNEVFKEAKESLDVENVEQDYILVGTTGNVFSLSGYTTNEYNTTGNDVVYATGRSSAGNFTLICVYDENDNYLGDVYRGQTTNYVDEEINLAVLYPNHSYVKVTGTTDSGVDLKINNPFASRLATKEDLDSLNLGYWVDKNIYWCGTSIPARGYPEQSGEMLGATVYNEAIGASFMRANVRTGDYVNAFLENIIRGMMQTKEEKQYMIDNWETIRSSFIGSPTNDLTQSQINIINSSSFEDILTPYLDGTNPFPDLFVIDHGHNDWKGFYEKSDGTPDIDLVPTRALELSGEIAEDTYMTANNYANLELFMGDLSNIPDKADFAAKLNRNCYIGAVNFFITYVLKHNPRARFMFVSNNRENKDLLLGAQDYNASNWMFPICRVNERLGYSSNLIPGTNNYWGDNRTSDLRVFDIYAEDGVHQSIDVSDYSIQQYAGILTEFIKTIR